MTPAPSSVKVAFFRRLPNSYGREYDVVLAEIAIEEARDRGKAIEQAIDRFERQSNICKWSILADGYRVIDQGR